jgi:F-type H+-transporting ATPase subunit c
MRKFAGFGLVLMAACLLAPAVFAAGQATGGDQTSTATWVVVTSGFAMAFASGLCGIAQAIASSGASQGFARNPAASTVIQNMLILALVLIESLALYTFVIVFVKVK